MLTDRALVDSARDMLRQEWSRAIAGRDSDRVDSDCPAVSLLPQLVDMIAESCDRPVAQLAPTIKRVIVERTFHGLCGDHAGGAGCAAAGSRSIERQVHVMVLVLERVRLSALAKGQWSTMPVTPQMFG